MPDARLTDRQNDIAVVGLAGRFPDARTPDELWRNLRAGVESVRAIDVDALRALGVDEEMLADPAYVKACAPLPDMPLFDAGFFGFSPKDAAILDPQHRHFLECAWEALENAGHPPERFQGSIGVFAGSGMGAYFAFNLLSNPDLVRSVGLFLLRHTGNDKDFLPTRVSYLLNLTGPSMAIQTACSSSLVAIHVASQHLLSGECDMALAGGVTIEIPHGVGYHFEPGGILSPDGHCRAFDAASQGTVFGSGVGVVVLRRLQDALESGDYIHAVIRGSAVNNDGSSKVGYLAPSVDGQAASILEALAVAGVSAESIGYVEAHGTGTPVGDPIEIAALTQAFRQSTQRTGFCGIGSLKTNIGHLDTAAGVASFIKVVEALKHRELPPSLHFTTPNPAVAFEQTPFYVNARLQRWTATNEPRRAGVSSLGVGGTNAHVILEEAPPQPAASPSLSRSLLLLSARSPAALDALARRYTDHLEATDDLDFADACYTTAVGRRAFEHRRIVVATDKSAAAAALRCDAADSPAPRASGSPAPSAVLMFPGGGAQYPTMSADLYREEPRYRRHLDRGFAVAASLGFTNLPDLLFPQASDRQSAAQALARPHNSIMSIFLVEFALAELWKEWGVEASAFIGHSLGEYVAAVLAGVISFEDAAAIVHARGEIFERLPEGAMLSVPLGESALRAMPEFDGLALAAVNGPELSVASGAVARIDALQQGLSRRNIDSRKLPIGVAAHSPMLDPFLDDFRRAVGRIRLKPPTMAFISNVSGTWADAAEVTTADYWVRHLRGTVRFSQGLETVASEPGRLLLEVGPGQTLVSLARAHRINGVVPTAIASLRHPQDEVSDPQTMLDALGRLWVAGLAVDWSAYYKDSGRRRVPLPTYAFEHRRYWIEPGAGVAPRPSTGSTETQPDLTRIANLRDWGATRTWRPQPLETTPIGGSSRYLVFTGADGLGDRVCEQLTARGHQVTAVAQRTSSGVRPAGGFVVDPSDPAAFDSLVRELVAADRLPDRVVHTWLADAGIAAAPVDRVQTLGFDSLVRFIQAVGSHDPEYALDLTVVTAGLEKAPGDLGSVGAACATVLGPIRVIGREYPSMRCRLVDLPVSTSPSETMARRLVDELLAPVDATAVALRPAGRFVESLAPLPLNESGSGVAFVDGGVYLITGGFGGLGLALAERLAPRRAKLVLVGPTALPPREEWSGAAADPASAIGRRIAAVQRLEAAGAEVMTATADVADEQALGAIVDAARARFGRLNGVLHAAGVIDDGPLQTKTADRMARVLRPKLLGALALDAALGDTPLDFLVLFSSTSALLGLPGQVDYAAANAFLDAFARQRSERRPGRTVAVQWGVWKEVGMAAQGVSGTPSGVIVHPLLGTETVRSDHELVFSSRLTTTGTWALDEHRLNNGAAILPGTAFVEMARAAGVRALETEAIQIADLLFLAPLEVGDPDTRTVRTRAQREATGTWSLSIASTAVGHDDWIEHVTATLSPAAPTANRVDLTEARASASIPVLPGSALDACARQGAHVRFGPRWQASREVMLGSGVAVGTLTLPAAYHADVDVFGVHPSLLDLATTCGLPLLEGYAQSTDLYAPFSYKRIDLYRTLPASIVALVHFDGAGDASDATVTFDVTIVDENGFMVASIQEFTLRRVVAAQLLAAQTAATAAPRRAGRTLLESLLAGGISATEGWDALSRVLLSTTAPEVVVSPLSATVIQRVVDQQAGKRLRQPGRRPEETSSAAGGSEADAEQAIASMWEDLLGVESVSPGDNFFELGGHSLIAVRLIARLEKRFNTRLRLSTLFEAPTVRQLAHLVHVPASANAFRSLTLVRAGGAKAPLFCVHAVGGEVLTYRWLAKALDPERAVYGLRCIGHDGGDEPLRDIPSQAELYLSEVRAVRPHGPYALAGYSHGGRVAYEMACRLVEAGEEVAFVGIIDTWVCEAVRRGFWYPLRWAANLARWVVDDLARTPWPANRARLKRLAEAAGRKLRSIAAPADTSRPARHVSDDMQIAHLPVNIQRTYEANFEAFIKYEPRRYSGDVTVFRATAQPLNAPLRPDHGWGDYVDGKVIVRVVRGNHGTIVDPPLVEALAHEMTVALDAADQSLRAETPRAEPAPFIGTRATSQG